MLLKLLAIFIFITTTSLVLSKTAEDEIKAEDKKMREDFINKKLENMRDVVEEIEELLNEYYIMDESFTDVFIQIDSQKFSIVDMKQVMTNPKSPALNRFKKGKAGDEQHATARDEYFKEEIQRFNKAVRKTEKFLAELEHKGDFAEVFKKLDEQVHHAKQLEDVIDSPEKLPKKSVLSETIDRVKTLVTPSAAKTGTPIKEDIAGVFKRLLGGLGDSKTVKSALTELTTLIRKNTKFDYSQNDLKTFFSTMEKLLQGNEKPIIASAASLLSHFTEKATSIPLFVKTNLLKLLVPLLDRKEELIVVPVLDIFNSIANHDEGIEAVIDSGALKHITNVFNLDDEDAHVTAISLITKITVKAIYKAKLVHFIANFLDASDRASRGVALTAISNIISVANEKQSLEIALDMGVACDLCNFLSNDDGEVVYETLESLTHLLENSGSRVNEVADKISGCGGVDIINDLQKDDDETIKEQSKLLISKYFQ
uniref:Uncharacterized protein n=1 Tax=Panagrolaimus sp. ES5 TaxID=591445 RepID=A0AC34FSU4_9BILA